MKLPGRLLWVDCTAAALAGVLVLALGGWLSRLYALTRDILLFTGVVNLLYASYSFSLAVRTVRPSSLIGGTSSSPRLRARSHERVVRR